MLGTETATAQVKLTAAGDTDIGSRDHNEDAILVRPDLSLFAVADGAGGENAGNVASALAMTTVAHFFESTEGATAEQPAFDELGLPIAARRLSTAIHRANREICDISRASKRHYGMGTTIVAALFAPEHGVVHVGHVGDSRCYRLRDGRLELLTHDHSLINDVLELRPDMPEHQAARLPRNVITRALGMADKVRVAMRSHAVYPGDRYILCSDGLTEALTEDEIVEQLDIGKNPEQQVRLLLERAHDNADDNLAALVIHCDVPRGTLPFAERPAPPLRRRPKRPSQPGGQAQDDSWPEIIVMGDEGPTEDSSPQIHVVPADSSSPDLMSALTGFVDSWHAPSDVGPDANTEDAPAELPTPTPRPTETEAASPPPVEATPRKRPRRDPTEVVPVGDPVQCGKCGNTYDSSDSTCPHCA